jgi:transcription factor IIIB subunit 2
MTTGDDEKDEAELYTMDDDGDSGVGMGRVIVEEEPGTVSLKPASEAGQSRRKKGVMALRDMDVDVEEEGSEDDKEDDVGWEDAYEQEV